MSSIVYAVYYQGSHQKSYLIITTEEAKARETADGAQGFPMERWIDGHAEKELYYDGNEQKRRALGIK